jgi:hypothetical protein
MRKPFFNTLIMVCFLAAALLSGGFVHAETASAQAANIVTSDSIRDAQKRISGQMAFEP